MLEVNVNIKIEGLKDLTAAIMALAEKGGVKTTLPVEEKEPPKRGRQAKKVAPVENVPAEATEEAREEATEEDNAEKEVVVDAEATKSNAATLYALSEAGASLLEAGKMTELIALLHSFQVEAVTMLKPEQYDAFATGLRKLGARI